MTVTEKSLPALPPLDTSSAKLQAAGMQPELAGHSGLSEVAPIGHQAGHVFSGKAEIPQYVETPLVAAVTTFYDKNIPTYEASANSKNGVMLSLPVSGMSPTNRRILEGFMEADQWLPEEDRRISIVQETRFNSRERPRWRAIIHGGQDETPESVAAFYEKIADQFEEQSLEWAGMSEREAQQAADQDYDVVEAGYVQARDGKFYPSKELAAKQNAWLAKQAGQTAK